MNANYSMTPADYTLKLQHHGVLDYSSACLQQCQNSSVKQFGAKFFSRVLENLSRSKTAATLQEGRTKQTGDIFTDQSNISAT